VNRETIWTSRGPQPDHNLLAWLDISSSPGLPADGPFITAGRLHRHLWTIASTSSAAGWALEKINLLGVCQAGRLRDLHGAHPDKIRNLVTMVARRLRHRGRPAQRWSRHMDVDLMSTRGKIRGIHELGFS